MDKAAAMVLTERLMGSVPLNAELDRRAVAEGLVATLIPANEDHGKRAIGRVISHEKWLSVGALRAAIEKTAPARKLPEHRALPAPEPKGPSVHGSIIKYCYQRAQDDAARTDIPDWQQRKFRKGLAFWQKLASAHGLTNKTEVN